MEYLNESKICREFLNQYSETLIPELLPKLIKVAIYSLYKTFHKWNISMQELDQFINFFNYKNRNLELESNYDNAPPCSPTPNYITPKINSIQKLNMGYQPPEELANSKTESAIADCFGYGRFYPNDEVYVNENNNFYDENYYIPRNRSYRNWQLYQKRLKNPKFITQEKRIYPDWWWNLKDDIDQDDYSEDNSVLDHYTRRQDRFPKDIEQSLKKKAKHIERSKSFSGIKPLVTRYYEESKIFPDVNTTGYDHFRDGSSNPRRYNSPSDLENSKNEDIMIVSDGFSRPIPNTMTDRNEPKISSHDIRDNPSIIINDPKYATSPLLRGPPNNHTPTDGIGGYRTQFIGNPDSSGKGTVGSGLEYPNHATFPNLRGPPNNLTPSDGIGGYRTQVNGNPDSLGTETVGSGSGDPKYATSPNLRGPPNNQTQADGIGGYRTQAIDSPSTGTVGPNHGSGDPSVGGISYLRSRIQAQVDPNHMIDGNPNKVPFGQTSKINENLASMQMSINRSILSTSLLKSKIKAKKETKESVALTYDKDFNISGAKVKRKGQIKKGLKYSLAGNQLKEDERGIIRRIINNQ